MTNTTASIIARMRAVLEAVPLSLVRRPERFTAADDLSACDRGYWIEPGAVVSALSQTNYREARVETMEISAALRVTYTEEDPSPMSALMMNLGRVLLADGDRGNYHVMIGSILTTYTRSREHMIGVMTVMVDYDLDLSACRLETIYPGSGILAAPDQGPNFGLWFSAQLALLGGPATLVARSSNTGLAPDITLTLDQANSELASDGEFGWGQLVFIQNNYDLTGAHGVIFTIDDDCARTGWDQIIDQWGRPIPNTLNGLTSSFTVS